MCGCLCMLIVCVCTHAHVQVERPYEDIRNFSIVLSAIFYWDKVSQWIQSQPLQLNWWQQSLAVLLFLPSQWWGYQEHAAVPGLLCECWFKLRPSCLGSKDSNSVNHLPTPEICCLWNCKHLPCSWEFASPSGTPQNIWGKWTQWIYLYVRPQAKKIWLRENLRKIS